MIEKINFSHNRLEYLECLEDLLGSSEVTPVDIFYKRIKEDRNYEVYVYTMDERIVATAAVVYEYKLKYIRPKASIEDVAVHKDYRGMGLGKKIVKYCIDVAEKKNCYKIALSCSDNLVDFYTGLGFTKQDNFMVRKEL